MKAALLIALMVAAGSPALGQAKSPRMSPNAFLDRQPPPFSAEAGA